MEDGLIQLLFILALVVASIFDAVSRSRKKRRRMEEMEAEADVEIEWGEEEPVAQQESSEEQPRETADAMVPDDLWAILTGQPRPGGTPQQEQKPERESRAEGKVGETPPPAQAPSPVGSYRTSSGSRSGHRWEPESDASEQRSDVRVGPPPVAAPPETRRSDRWMAGLEGRGTRVGRGDPMETSEVHAEAIADALGEPWSDLPDITAGEIRDDSVPTVERGSRDRPARGRRRGGSASRYTELLESGDTDSLRKAIVLREVLGAPAGLRGSSDDGWPERGW